MVYATVNPNSMLCLYLLYILYKNNIVYFLFYCHMLCDVMYYVTLWLYISFFKKNQQFIIQSLTADITYIVIYI